MNYPFLTSKLLYEQQRQIGLDPETVFSEAAAFFGNETATNILDFPSRRWN
jgi:hypothetical protein